MNRTQLAGYTMLASAFVLTAMIFLQASRLIDTQAHAEMVVNKGSVTMISTQFRGDSEIVYVLDSRQGRLMAYIHDPNAPVIKLLENGVMDLPREFGKAFAGGQQPTQPEKKRPR